MRLRLSCYKRERSRAAQARTRHETMYAHAEQQQANAPCLQLSALILNRGEFRVNMTGAAGVIAGAMVKWRQRCDVALQRAARKR